MHPKIFFPASKQASKRITELFEFVWSTSAAQWNLRWQIGGFLQAKPTATDKELDDRFVAGSGVHGASLRRACVDTTWESQQEQFAKFLLIDLCAMYESWIDAMGDIFKFSRTVELQLQSPSTAPGGGVGKALSGLLQKRSPEMEALLYPGLRAHRKNSLAQIEELLVCYRYFKECRNSIAHRGASANQATLDAYGDFAGQTAKSLGLAEVPVHHGVSNVGDPVKLNLRGVVGFGEVVLRLIITLDAELSKSQLAEDEFVRRWAAATGRRMTLPGDLKAKAAWIAKGVRKLEIPPPASTLLLLPLLERRGLALKL